MQALTIRQPYANAVVRGTKTIENRSRNTNMRGPVLIHAAGALHEHFRGTDPGLFVRSAIVGQVNVIDSHEAATCGFGCLAGGGFVAGVDPVDPAKASPWHWVLADAVEFRNPILDVRGALGFWKPSEFVLDQHAFANLDKTGRAS